MDLHQYSDSLTALAAMSNRYGADPEYVLAGGGNTSFKSEKLLWVKGSGTALATIRPGDFVVLSRERLNDMWSARYPENEAARESAVLKDMMAARIEGETRRPSVETLLHNLFPQRYVLHVHPALVNGITCSVEGEAAMKRLLPEAVWVEACKPGYLLALACKTVMDDYRRRTGRDCDLLFLQNHGIFFAADTVEALDALAGHTMDTLSAAVSRRPDLTPTEADGEAVRRIAGALRECLGGGTVRFLSNPAIASYDPATGSLSPDHIVYAKARQLVLPEGADAGTVRARFAAFTAENGYSPRIAFAQKLGMFACGASEAEAAAAEAVMLDAVKVTVYAGSFGGVSPMPAELVDFIVNWEAESYRSKVSLSEKK